jgi:hypothetical protein
MKTIKMLYLLTLLLSFSACGGAKSTENAVSNIETIGNESCIKDYMTKYDKLLPLEVIKIHYDLPANAKMKYNYRPEAKRHDQDTYEFTWDSGRKRKMKFGGQEMEYPSPNRIGLRWVGSDLFMIQGKPTPLENFRGFYRNASAAEKEAAFKQASEKLIEKGYDGKTVETATSLGKDLSADEIIFKNIDGLGEAAVWRIKEKELTVLVGKTSFQVSVEISENDEENIALAKKLAQEVLNKCK